MIKLYHNPRCAKSRQGLALLENSKHEFETILYLKNPLNKKELEHTIALLGISPLELIRKNEAIWKENYKGKTLSDTDIISAMTAHPKLIERPIVSNGDKAVIGRPTERIFEIL
jgi:arsenate reductase